RHGASPRAQSAEIYRTNSPVAQLFRSSCVTGVKASLRPWRGLFGLGLLLARPTAREALEYASHLVVDGGPGAPEHCPLEDRRGDQLAEARIAVLGLRRLPVVDHPPELLEQLPACEARDQSPDDAERDEEQLQKQVHAWNVYPSASRVGICRKAKGGQ